MKKAAVKSNRKPLTLVTGRLRGNGCRGPNLNKNGYTTHSKRTGLQILQAMGHHRFHLREQIYKRYLSNHPAEEYSSE